MESVAEVPNVVGRALAQSLAGERAGGAEADDVRHVLGAGTQPMLVAGSMDQRVELSPGADVQRADALGCVQLVAG